MGSSQTREAGKAYQKNRIETLTDGVFAISMTLLVTGLDIPKLNGIATSGTVDSILFSMVPDFIHYIIAFALLANFWWASHLRSHYLLSIDRKMSLLNIFTLLFVGLIPFSTNLAGDFPTNTHAVIIFELNLFVIGLLSVLQWNQIFRNTGCLDPNADIDMLPLSREEAFIFPALSVLAMLLAIVSIPWGIFVHSRTRVYRAYVAKGNAVPCSKGKNRIITIFFDAGTGTGRPVSRIYQ
jgi:uncharacterized membrane protein